MKQLKFNLQPSFPETAAHGESPADNLPADWLLPRPHRGQGAPIRVVEVQSLSQAH